MLPYIIAEIVFLALLAWVAAAFFWTILASAAPIGGWPSAVSGTAVADRGLLARFDPFFRLADVSGPAVVTSLPLRLTGTRVDQAMGRGSAIILTPDGLQASYAVGDTIVPGVILKSVAFDAVTVERGGIAEQLFIDQSKPATIVGAASGIGSLGQPPLGPPPSGAAPPPSVGRGAVTGFLVTGQGASGALAAAGLQPGDVVTQINGNTVRSAEEAAQAVANRPPSGEMTVSVDRGGKTITLSTKVPK